MGLKEPWEQVPKPVKTKPGCSVASLVDLYLLSEDFRYLKPKSKATFLGALRKFEFCTLYTGKSVFASAASKVDFSTASYIKKLMAHELAPATISLYFGLMSAIWRWGARRNIVFINPWSGHRLKVKNERDTTWTPKQIDDAIAGAKEMGFPMVALYILFSYETGQRPWSDIRFLEWTNVSTDENGLPYLRFTIKKTDTKIQIPITPRLKAEIDAVPRVSRYIFGTSTGKTLTSSAIQYQFAKIRTKIGLPADLLFRDLRRTMITELAENGCTPLEIEALTGWRGTDAVIRKYARIRYKTALNAFEKRENGKAGTNI